MPAEITYTNLRKNLPDVLDEVVDQVETVIVRRKGSRDVAIIAANELNGLIETTQLGRSTKSARQLRAELLGETIG